MNRVRGLVDDTEGNRRAATEKKGGSYPIDWAPTRKHPISMFDRGDYTMLDS
jgi:hypothetical protein